MDYVQPISEKIYLVYREFIKKTGTEPTKVVLGETEYMEFEQWINTDGNMVGLSYIYRQEQKFMGMIVHRSTQTNLTEVGML